MKIVTGYTGEPHISSNDDQGKNQGIFGVGNAVLNVGNKFAATMPNVNTVSIQDGEGVMQGVHFRVEPGTVDNVTIENGTAGYKQIILIGAHYEKDSVTGVESIEWQAIAGNPVASDPATPTYTNGDILAGDLEAFYPMFQVYLDGLTPTLTRLCQERFMKLHTGNSLPATATSHQFRSANFSLPRGTYLITCSIQVILSSAPSGTVYSYPWSLQSVPDGVTDNTTFGMMTLCITSGRTGGAASMSGITQITDDTGYIYYICTFAPDAFQYDVRLYAYRLD